MVPSIKIRSKYTGSELKYAALLLLILQGNMFLKLPVLFILLLVNFDKILLRRTGRSALFYIYVIFTILISFLTIGWLHHVNYVYSLTFSLIIWLFCLFLLNYNYAEVKARSVPSLRRTLDIVFVVNLLFSFGQLVMLMINQKTLNPYSGIYKGATGDFIYGIFANSSVNMIFNAFFFFYYFMRKQTRKYILAGIVVLMTTFMAGLLLAVGAFVIILLLSPAIRFQYKAMGLAFIVLAYIGFSIVSPENVEYASNNIKAVLSERPPRKLVSFKETWKYSTETPLHGILGAGPGNFSSRTAFIMGGEYVSWVPGKMVYRSGAFSENHFRLWNQEILSKPYQDGTANQPFSLYNQLIGEYGLIGVMAFFMLYLGHYFKNYKQFTYGKYLLVFMLLVFILDYWFEYISVVVLFEIFMLLQLKELSTENSEPKA